MSTTNRDLAVLRRRVNSARRAYNRELDRSNDLLDDRTAFETHQEHLREIRNDMDVLEDAYERALDVRDGVDGVDIDEESWRGLRVSEPDMYRRDGPNGFLRDLYMSQMRHDLHAGERIAKHQEFEQRRRGLDGFEERAGMASGDFGGLIPPDYLVSLYAKASRNGRVFCDQVNRRRLADTGMSQVVPRLTQGASADVQSAENAALSNQDLTETDLTIDVRTIGGYVTVSRQALERSVYDETLIFEDLIARYWQKLDAQAINGDGTGVNLLGLLNTTGINTSVALGGALSEVYSNIADVVQQINAATGGLGYVATKMVMHPRRWGIFVASKDSTNRPLLGINGLPAFNIAGQGDAAGYGYVGTLQGLEVYVDANVPTTLGVGSDEDAILIFAHPVVHLWEQDPENGTPITLKFEQRQGNALSVDLVVYGYTAFSAGRYPGASGAVTGLVTPSFS